MPTTTWDSSLKASGITLSNSNKTATAASGTNPSVMSNHVISGPTYCEFAINVRSGNYAIGVCNRSYGVTANQLPGTGTGNSVGFNPDGTVKIAASTIATIFTYTQGDRIQMAVLPAYGTIFFKKNNTGDWNNTVGADPATNTGGISFETMSEIATLRPIFGAAVVTPNQVCIAAFASADWSYSAPSGLSTIETLQAAATCDQLPTLVAARSDPLATPYQFTSTMTPGYGPGGDTDISGLVTELGVSVAKRVRIYDQDTGQFLGTALSDAGTGVYSIPAFGRQKVFAVAFDDPAYRALVYDDVAPV